MQTRIFFLLLLSTICNERALAQFIDVSDQFGLNITNEGNIYGNGVSFYDFNGDGWDDVSIADGATDPHFYINNNGTLEPAPFTIPNSPPDQTSMLLWADYDNDGDNDLLYTKQNGALQLWNNDGNLNFTNVATAAGLDAAEYYYWGAAYCDVDHDGWLDLFVAKYYHPSFNPQVQYRSVLYHNNGDGTFTDQTIASGINLPPRTTFQPVFLDYNGDGWEDLFLVIDRIQFTNELYENNGDGTFTNVTLASGTNQAICSMTGTVDDFDNDTDLDIYVTNSPNGNLLLQNNGNETYTNVAAAMGVLVNQTTWGSMWIDYDNDTWQDLWVSLTSPILTPIGNQFFVNNAGSSFTQANALAGIDDDDSQTYQCAMGDLNNDGYYDFALSNDNPYPAKLYRNDGGTNNFLSVELEGVIANRNGIGSWIHCYAGGEHYVRFTHCGENFVSQNSGKEIFGLGEIAVIDSLVVDWNSGTHDVYENVAVNQLLHLIEGASYAQPFTIQYDGDLYLCPGDSLVLDAGVFESYLWNTGDTTQYITVYDSGVYSVETTQQLGNFESLPVEVVLTDVPSPQIAITDVNCFGENSGAVALDFGTENLENMFWNNGVENTPELNDIAAGQYIFSALTAAGCGVEITCVVNSPAELQAWASATDATCYAMQNGSVEIIASGGTEPYNIEWAGLSPLSLAAGDYEVVLNDAHGCEVDVAFSIGQPDSITYNYTTQNVTCFGLADGSVQITFEGGTPEFVADWNELNPGALTAGEYTIEAEDAQQCPVVVSFSILQPDELDAEITTTDALCFGEATGTAALEISGGTPGYIIDWNGNNPEALAAGLFEAVVTDSAGCSSQISFTITEPDEIVMAIETEDIYELGETGSATLLGVGGGTEPYFITWLSQWGDTLDVNTMEVENLIAGIYKLTITDANGCTLEGYFEIWWIGITEIVNPSKPAWPNPADDYILLPDAPVNATTLLFSNDGRLVLETIGNYVNTTNLPSGIYSLMQGNNHPQRVQIIHR